MHAAPRNGDFVTPTVVGAEEYDFAERDLRYTDRDVPPAHQRPGVRRPQQGRSCRTGCPPGPPRAITAARTLQPLWSQPDTKPPRFEDGLDAVKSRFAAILTDLNLDAPKELAQ